MVTGAHQEGADVGLRTGVSSVADVGPVHRQPPANVDNLLGVCWLHVSSKVVRSSALQLPQWGPAAGQCPGRNQQHILSGILFLPLHQDQHK